MVEINQEGKPSIYTTDFYFTNKAPSDIVVPAPGLNSTSPTGDKAATVDTTLFDTVPLQQVKTHLHSWMLYTLQPPILDLTDKVIKSTQDFEQEFNDLNLCPKEEDKGMLDGRKVTLR